MAPIAERGQPAAHATYRAQPAMMPADQACCAAAHPVATSAFPQPDAESSAAPAAEHLLAVHDLRLNHDQSVTGAVPSARPPDCCAARALVSQAARACRCPTAEALSVEPAARAPSQ